MTKNKTYVLGQDEPIECEDSIECSDLHDPNIEEIAERIGKQIERENNETAAKQTIKELDDI